MKAFHTSINKVLFQVVCCCCCCCYYYRPSLSICHECFVFFFLKISRIFRDDTATQKATKHKCIEIEFHFSFNFHWSVKSCVLKIISEMAFHEKHKRWPIIFRYVRTTRRNYIRLSLSTKMKRKLNKLCCHQNDSFAALGCRALHIHTFTLKLHVLSFFLPSENQLWTETHWKRLC